MEYWSIAACSLLLSSMYMKRDVILSHERSIGFLLVGCISFLAAIFLLLAFLIEFAGIFFFLIALVLFVYSLK